MHQAISPAKLILSGEHAVVYGCPALAMTIDQYITVNAERLKHPILSINGSSLSSIQINMLDAFNRYLTLQSRYQTYLRAPSSLGQILTGPHDLILFSTLQTLEALQIDFSNIGLHLNLESTIPMGYGLGSSAAAICATIYAIMDVFGTLPVSDNVFPLALNAEHLQHGRSSGLDIKTVLNGGCLLFEKDTQKKRVMPRFPLFLVNTGRPQSSTGESVHHVRAHFKNTHLLNAFADTTSAIDKAVSNTKLNHLIDAIRQNHRLLIHIGVVPQKVQQFIKDIEHIGGAAKICGAGSVKGETAGMCLVVSEQPIDDLCLNYGFYRENLQYIEQGVYLS